MSHIILKPISNLKLKSVTGTNLNVLGSVNVEALIANKRYHLEAVVIATGYHFKALSGRRWLNIINPSWRNTLLKSQGAEVINSIPQEAGDHRIQIFVCKVLKFLRLSQ